jgi:hypothetical protein
MQPKLYLGGKAILAAITSHDVVCVVLYRHVLIENSPSGPHKVIAVVNVFDFPVLRETQLDGGVLPAKAAQV